MLYISLYIIILDALYESKFHMDVRVEISLYDICIMGAGSKKNVIRENTNILVKF